MLLKSNFVSLVMHGVSSDKSSHSFVKFSEELAENLDFKIDSIASGTKSWRGKNAYSRFKKAFGSDSSFPSVELVSDADNPARGSTYSAHLMCNNEMSMWVLVLDECLFKHSQEKLFENLCSISNATYGFMHSRARIKSPDMYALGMGDGSTIGATGEERDDSVNMNHWAMTGVNERVYEKGFIRDVYDYNLLNKSQITRKVEGIGFDRWASQAKGSSLVQLDSNRFLWKVDEQEQAVLKGLLSKSGLLFDWRKYSTHIVN